MDEFLFGLAGLHPQSRRFTHRTLCGAEWDGIAAQGGSFSRFHWQAPRYGTHDSQNAEGRGVFTFTVLETALLFPQTESMSKGLALVPFEAEMNQQILTIRSLPDGDYALAIDDIPVGAWSAGAFKAGINLAPLTTTPQYQQTLEVKRLNDLRAKEASRLRTAALVYYGSGLFDSGVDPKDATAVQVSTLTAMWAVQQFEFAEHLFCVSLTAEEQGRFSRWQDSDKRRSCRCPCACRSRGWTGCDLCAGL